MGIDGDARDIERMAADNVGGFSANTGKAGEICHRRRHLGVEFVNQLLSAAFE